MVQYENLPIWVEANWLLILLELVVRQFPRYHKYAQRGD